MNSVHASIIAITEEPLDAWLLKIPGNIAVSGAGIAFLSAQITNLEHRCTALHARSAIHGSKQFKLNRGPHKTPRGNMEATVTQNSALYLAHLRTSKDRVRLFRRYAAAAKKNSLNRQSLTFRNLNSDFLEHRDNGR